MDIANNFYQEVLQVFEKKNVKYILIGGLAVGFHGYQRYAGDMDLWLKPLKNDKKFIVEAAAKAQKAVDYILNQGS